MYDSAPASYSTSMNPDGINGSETPPEIARKISGQISAIPGYEEMKTVLLTGSFSSDQGHPMAGKPVIEFEIKQVLSHPSSASKPLPGLAGMTVRNLLSHSLSCTYTLRFGTVGFQWEISAELVLNPNEKLELGVLPSFFGVITDAPFEVSLSSWSVFDETPGISIR